jgi:hypothetical protein
MNRLPATALLVLLATGLFACGAAAQDTVIAPPQTQPRRIVYFTDFELDAADVTLNTGPRQRVGHLLGNILPRGPLAAQSDPAARARQIVNLMSQSLLADLQHAGADARRLPPGAPAPASGTLVRGIFLSADEGNRLRRAVIGLQSGQAKLQVAVAVDTLSPGILPAPLYAVTDNGAGKPVPGAIVTMNPYAAVAKFVLDGQDLDAAIKSTAKKITEQVMTPAP